MNFIPILIYVFVFVFGTIIGSFLNVVIFRLKDKKDFIHGRSKCRQCKHILKWYENIPLLSFIFLQGKCLKCKSKISWQYPLVELVTGILFLLSFLQVFNNFICVECWQAVFLLFFYWLVISWLILIFVYDAKYFLIPDKISIPAMASVFIWQIILLWVAQDVLILQKLISLILGAVVVGGFFLLQFLISKGKWVGGGDIRLGVLMGLILGWQYALIALFLSYIIGMLYALVMLTLGKKKMQSKIAFGCFLSTATLIVLLWGEEILNWYLKLLT